ncbi:MAG: DUF5696 domain-containing protein [Lachnospiraceae bacterium]|nr:DUF5696 domain-containing protein [Lachnospiraceae bacterium]
MAIKKRKTKWARFVAIYLVTALFLLSFAPSVMAETQSEDPTLTSFHANSENDDISSDYEKVTENEDFELYLAKPNLSILIKDKASGSILRSTLDPADDDGQNNDQWMGYMQSGIVLTAIKGTTDTYQVDLNTCKNQIQYTYQEDGFSAKITFEEYGFGLTVDVALEGRDLVVRVADDSITETIPNTYIGMISLFPFLGYTYLDAEEGYLFIPDGNGALIHLNDKHGRFSSGFSQMIYGNDAGFTESTTDTFLMDDIKMNVNAQKVLMPVFGMMHTADQLGYLAIVEEGEKRATIEAQPNGVMVDYNRCYTRFLLRRTYVQPLNNSNSGTITNVETDRTHSDLAVRYRLLSGENADYAGMANSYRDYLLSDGLLTAKDTSYRTRVDFLGSDREQFLVFTRSVPMTTTDDIREMYTYFQSMGVETLLSVYKGWQKGGIFDLPITSYRADSNIGGTSDLTKLIKESSENGYELYLYNDALQANPDTSNTTFNIVKRVNKRRLTIQTYGQVYDEFHYLLPSRTAANLDKFVKSYTKRGVDNLALSNITDHLFAWSYSGDLFNRYDAAQSYLDTVTKVAEQTDLIMETPFLYLWEQTDAFLDTPIASSDYMYVDAEVPFLSMVLKGTIPLYSDYINFQANQHEYRLQMIETGVYPSFYLTKEDSSDLIYTNSSDLYSTLYTVYQDEVVAYDQEFRELAQLTQDAYMIDHETVATGVNAVTYDNGVKIYINYNESAVTVDGMEIAAMSYKVGEAHE